MGHHIHFKDGKFNVWSTVTDSYEYEQWLERESFFKDFVATETYFAVKKIVEDAKEGMVEAEKNNGCSIPYPNMRCKRI